MALVSPNGVVVGLLTPAQAAEYLACSQRTLRNYVAGGMLFVQIGRGHRRFRVEDLRAWVEGRVLQSSTSRPTTATSSSTDSPRTAFDTEDPQAAEIERELRQRLSGSTPRRSPKSPSRRAGTPVVLPLRKT